jgi:hypothetical protein
MHIITANIMLVLFRKYLYTRLRAYLTKVRTLMQGFLVGGRRLALGASNLILTLLSTPMRRHTGCLQ